MLKRVINKNGKIVDIEEFDKESWDELKRTHKIGNFKTICCNVNTIPKTSIKFVKFFAHQNNQCLEVLDENKNDKNA
ncbi:hypothetical protein [Sphingobacterium daejeonense]|uniref:hypothetical protein n=1 Tax=Sphingobacterium daejeonense TaxID=371142 RepID=UPI003D317C7A